MHRVEEGVEGGGGFRAKVACHNIKRYNADGSACGAVAGGRIRLREDAYPAAARGHAGQARALLVRVRRSGFEAATSPSVGGDAGSRRGRLPSLALSLEEDDLPGLEGG